MKVNPFADLLDDEQRGILAGIFARNRALYGNDAFRMEGDDNPEPEDEPSQEDEPEEPEEPESEPEDSFDADKALAKIRKLNSENKNLREAKKAAEEKAAGADEKDQRIKALEADLLRTRIGAKHGLPDELIDRLQGDTEEEILADAEKLLAILAGKKPPRQKPKERLRGGTEPAEEPEETDPRKLAALIPRQ